MVSTTFLHQVQVRRRSRDRRVDILVLVLVVVGALINGAVGALSLFAPAAFLNVVGQGAQDVTPATAVLAHYAGGRELALAAALVVFLGARAWPLLVGALIVAALANAIDAAGATAAQRWVQLPGAVLFAVVYACAAIWLSRSTSRFTLS
jgi:hypothetical protein